MDKIMLLKELIAKTTDEKELDRLNKELVEAIREDERKKLEAKFQAEQEEKAKKEAEEKAAKELEEKRQKAAGKGIFNGPGRIEVGTPGLYKGVSLKLAMQTAKDNFSASPFLKACLPRMEANPEGLEGVVKHFTDLYDNAVNNPYSIKAAMSETAANGGYLTPTEQRSEILAYIRETSVAMQDCQHVQMTSDSMTIPAELTKVSVSYTAEGNAATESDPTFDQVTLTAKRMDAYSVASNELIQDTANPGGIVGLLLSQFVEAIGQKIDSTVFKGTGDPVSSVFASAGYSQVFGTGSAAFSMLLETDLRSIIAKIPTSRLGNAKWYVHRSPAWTYLYGLKDSSGRLLFIPSMNQANPHMLYGYPVRMPEQAPSTTAASTGFIVFGDLKGFMIGDRLTNISLFIDPYSKSTSYQTMFLMFTRWAFAHALPNYYGRIVTAA